MGNAWGIRHSVRSAFSTVDEFVTADKRSKLYCYSYTTASTRYARFHLAVQRQNQPDDAGRYGYSGDRFHCHRLWGLPAFRSGSARGCIVPVRDTGYCYQYVDWPAFTERA
ncbi:hypothetical protein D3C77_529970 [compost metagenome]